MKLPINCASGGVDNIFKAHSANMIPDTELFRSDLSAEAVAAFMVCCSTLDNSLLKPICTGKRNSVLFFRYGWGATSPPR